MKSLKILLTLFLCTFVVSVLSVTSYANFNGDVNDDTIYSTEDSRLTLMYVAGLETPDTIQEVAADINRDGYITTDDAREILRIACELSTAPEHQYTVWLVTKEPTCTTDGSAESGCYNCEEIFHKIIPATGHTPQGVTCTTSGTCKTCNTTIPATGHTLVDGVCSQCGYSTIKPSVTYKGTSLAFGTSAENIKTLLGNPTEILYDNSSTLGRITIYVYATDYKNLGIFTFTNNKLTQFYSNNSATKVSDSKNSYSLKNSSLTTNITVGEIKVIQYVDTLAESGQYVYSYLATVGEEYTFYNIGDKFASEKIVFHLTNGMRALHGQKALTYCSTVATAAYKHSLDMATRNYFDHYTPEGNGPGERMTAEGIKWYGYAENIAAGYTDAYNISNGWYNSEGHRHGLLLSYLEKLGVGIVCDENTLYRFYGTQNFYC